MADADDEASLLAAIAADPEDEQAREVYADWLDKRADVRGEYVRLEALYHAIPPRMAKLVAQIDPAWLARVARHYDVIVVEAGANKIGVIKLVRELSGLGLKDAKDVVDNVTRGPQRVVAKIDRYAALRIVDRFRETGAVASAVTHGTAASVTATSTTVVLPRGVRVVLESVEPVERIAAITIMRELCGYGIRDAYRLVEQVIKGTPMPLYPNASVEQAGEVVRRFASVGVVRCTPT